MAKYLGRPHGKPPSQTWRTFLTNHVSQLASVDFFTVPTATYRVLFVFVVLLHDRRRVVHVNVTAHPTSAWTAQQLREAWPWESAPRFVIRDRDGIYGPEVQATMRAMGIEEVVIAPRAPWQNPFVERVIGSLRRHCLDRVIVRAELRHTSSIARRVGRPSPRILRPPAAPDAQAFRRSRNVRGVTTRTRSYSPTVRR